jgi:rod shape-determining protein MreC
VFVALSGALIALDQARKLQPAENAASGVFQPVQTTLTDKTQGIFDFWSTLGQINKLREDNTRLTAEVQRLQLENSQLQRAASENQTLRQQLSYAQANAQFKLMPATVIGKDLHGLSDFIEIDRGSKDGLQREMTVVSPDGYLVGRVSDLTDNRSRIMIITNPSSSVAGTITNASGQAEDVVDGQLHGRLVMGNVPQSLKVQKGDEVRTSGLGTNFPRGVRIGQVGAVKNNDVQLFQSVEVAPYCDFAKLTAVQVITNNLPTR